MNRRRAAATAVLLFLVAGSLGAYASVPEPAHLLVPGDERWRGEFGARSDPDLWEVTQNPHLLATPDGTAILAAAIRTQRDGAGQTPRLHVAAFDAQSGDRLWVREAPGTAWSARTELLPWTDLLVVAGGNNVSALNVTDGGLRWSIEFASAGGAAFLASGNNRVFVGGISYADGGKMRILALDATTAVELWRVTLPKSGADIATNIDGSLLFVAGTEFDSAGAVAHLRALDAATGAEVLHLAEQGATMRSLHHAADGSVLLVVSASAGLSREITAYDPDTFQRRWRTGVPQDHVVAVDVASDSVVLTGMEYANGRQGRTIALALPDGSTRWSQTYEGSMSPSLSTGTSLQLRDGIAYVTYAAYKYERSAGHDSTLGEVTLIAHDLLTGQPIWSDTEAPASTSRHGAALALAPDGTRAYVASQSAESFATMVRALETRFAPFIVDGLPLV